MRLCRMVRVYICSLLFVATVVGSAGAAPVIFTDEAAFQAAVATAGLTLGHESFEGAEAGWQGPLDLGPFTYGPDNFTPFVFISDDPADATDGTQSAVGLALQPPTFTFDTGIRAFALDVVGALDDPDAVLDQFFVTVDGTFEQAVFGGDPSYAGARFIGLLDLDNPFRTLTFSSTNFIDTFSVDRVQYDAATPVPEPASLTLLGVGLIATAARLRRRSRRGRPQPDAAVRTNDGRG